MADNNYENFGVEITVDGVNSAVSNLDRFEKRYEKIAGTEIRVAKAEIALKNAHISLQQSEQSLANATTVLKNAKKQEEIATNNVAKANERLLAIQKNENATELQRFIAQQNYNNALLQQGIAENNLTIASTNLEKARETVEKKTNAVTTAELSLQQAMEAAEKQQNRTTKSLTAYLAKLSSGVMIARRLGRFVSGAIQESANYVENLNLFAVAYGDVYQDTLKWALNLADGFGLASNEVIKFAGTFRQLSTSLGLVEDTANSVSQTVTQLGYDMSALFNTTVENAMEKLQSGLFSGNVRPLRAYGIDISQNQIDALFETNQALASLGVNARNLSQSDKVLARLIITLRDGSNAFGTMNREINTLQSQIRILQGSFSNFKLAIGDLVQEPVRVTLTYLNAFIIAMTSVIRAFHPLQDEDKNAFTGVAMGAEEANEAIDELNGKLATFDKFNVLGGQSSGGSQLAVTEALTAELEKQQKLYQEQVDAMSKIKNEAVEMSKSIVDWFIELEGYDKEGNPIYGLTDQVELLSSALMALISIKVYNWIFNLISSMKLATGEFNLMATASNVLAGAGLFLLISNTIDLIKNWDELDGKGKAIRITMIAVGGALTLFSTLTKIALKDTTLLTTAFKLQKVAAIGLAVGGIGLLVANLTNLIGNWDELNGFEKVIGIFGAVGAAALAAAAAVAAFHGSWTLGTAIPAIVGGLLAITAAFATFKKDTQDVKGFADGGYTNANLIMTHENGKREWVGKAAGSSAIVNDTQMSDIMESAVAKGVYRAMSSSRTDGGSGGTTKNVYNFQVNGRTLLSVMEDEARKQGKTLARI